MGDRLEGGSVYAEERALQPETAGPELAGSGLSLSFELPGAPGLETRLTGHPMRYWLLELSADLGGRAFLRRFLLPVC